MKIIGCKDKILSLQCISMQSKKKERKSKCFFFLLLDILYGYFQWGQDINQ